MGVHDGHRDRMKQRFVHHGLDSFEDHSVLELLLFYCIPRKDTNEIAHRLMAHFGSLPAVFEARYEDLLQVEGIGENAAVFLSLIPQVCRRYQISKANDNRPIHTSEDAGRYLLPLYLYAREEIVYLMCLDAKSRLMSLKELGRGSLNEVIVSIRAIVETALAQNATAVILSHNHVEGVAVPSYEDRLTTCRVRDALSLVGITLADHIVVCDGEFVSFADSGMLNAPP